MRQKHVKILFFFAAMNLLLGQIVFVFFQIGKGVPVYKIEYLHLVFFILSVMFVLAPLILLHRIECNSCGKLFHGKLFRGKVLNTKCVNCGMSLKKYKALEVEKKAFFSLSLRHRVFIQLGIISYLSVMILWGGLYIYYGQARSVTQFSLFIAFLSLLVFFTIFPKKAPSKLFFGLNLFLPIAITLLTWFLINNQKNILWYCQLTVIIYNIIIFPAYTKFMIQLFKNRRNAIKEIASDFDNDLY